MKFFKIAFVLACFNKGYGVTAPLKVVAMALGVAIAMGTNIKGTIIFGVCYMIFCLILGFILYKIGFAEAEAEVANVFNPFAKQIRKKFGVKELGKSI
jgi:mannose/fructose/N-acetylgalactosamine-specific phosphotransferase system component IID